MFSAFTKRAAETTEASAENDIRDEFKPARHDIHAAASHAEKLISDAADDVSSYADHANHKIRHFADKARHEVKDAAHHLSDRVRGNPVPAALISLGIGIVLGLVMRSPRRPSY